MQALSARAPQGIEMRQVLDLADALGMDAGQLNTRKIGQSVQRRTGGMPRRAPPDPVRNDGSATWQQKVANGAPRRCCGLCRGAGTPHDDQGDGSRIGQLNRGRCAPSAISAVTISPKLTVHRLPQDLQRADALSVGGIEADCIDGQRAGRFQAIRDLNPTVWQKTRAGILSWFINNLISGPITHAGYMVGNTVNSCTRRRSRRRRRCARRDPQQRRLGNGCISAKSAQLRDGPRRIGGLRRERAQGRRIVHEGDPESLATAGRGGRLRPASGSATMATPSRAVAAIHMPFLRHEL